MVLYIMAMRAQNILHEQRWHAMHQFRAIALHRSIDNILKYWNTWDIRPCWLLVIMLAVQCGQTESRVVEFDAWVVTIVQIMYSRGISDLCAHFQICQDNRYWLVIDDGWDGMDDVY